jgi:phosphatidylglycerol:prolipoprotein diacylglycerol transferase
MAFAFGFSAYLGYRKGGRTTEGKSEFQIAFFAILLGTALGSHLMPLWTEDNPPPRSTSFYGGVLGSLAALYAASRIFRFSFLKWADIASSSVAFGIFVGRIACFVSGCCWGTSSSLPWAVLYPASDRALWPPPIPVHPVQLYDAALGLILFVVLERGFSARRYAGESALQFFVGYALVRFFTEFFRGDLYRGYVLDGILSVSQAFSLLVLCVGLPALLFLRSRTPDKLFQS